MKKRLLSLMLVVLMIMLSACSSGGNEVSGAYDEALNAMKQGNYTEAVDKLAGISFYQDSAQLSLYCRAHAKAAEGDYDYAVEQLRKLGSYRDAAQSAAYFAARKAEDTAEDPYSRAYAAGLYDQDTVNGFRDSTARAASIREKLYEEGLKAQEAEIWSDAVEIFGVLSKYQDSEIRCHYASGRLKETDGERAGTSYAYAAVQYDYVQDYLDSADRKEQCITAAYRKADQLIGAADKASDPETAAANLDGAEEIYRVLADLCSKDKLTKLEEARARAAEAERQRLIAKADALLAEKQFDEARGIYLQAEEPQKAGEALYLKAEHLAGEGKPEEAAGQYRQIFEYKDSREKHYLLGHSRKESDPETASWILLNDREYPGAEDDLYEIALKATEAENYPLSISVYSELSGKKDCSLRMLNDLYLYGQRLMQEENPEKAASVFDRLKGVGSADLYANMARYAAAEALEKNGSYEAAAKAFDLITDYTDAADRADNCRYQLAGEKKKDGQYLEAARIFAAQGEREDSAEQAKDCRYLQAGVYADRQSWEDAIELYEALSDYAESKARCRECYRELGLQQMADGLPEKAYQSFVSAGDADGQAKAAFAVGEVKTAGLEISEALKWYNLASKLPETEERTAMIAQSLLNMEEDSLSEQYASVVSDSEKAQNVLYALALRSLERKDEEAAMRQMKKAGDNADASERFKAMLNERVETLISEEKYDDAIFLCNTYGEQERAEEIRTVKAEKEETERQKAREAEEEAHREKAAEAEQLLKEEKYEDAAAIYSEIGETEMAAKALAEKEAAEEAARAAEETARMEAEKAEREKIQARMDEAAGLLEEGRYDEALVLYRELNNQEMVCETIYQKAAALDQPDLYLGIMEYRDSREQHYLAGKALLDIDPEKAFSILSDDIAYKDVKAVLYEQAYRESKAENYRLSYKIFDMLAELPLDPENPMPDCRMRSEQDLYLYGLQLQNQKEWEAAAEVFDQLKDFGNAHTHALESRYAAAAALEEEGKYIQAAHAFEKLSTYSDAQERILRNQYSAAMKQMESGLMESAAIAFEKLENYKDAAEMAKECRFKTACDFFDSGNYTKARDLFAELGEYSDSPERSTECIYQIAEQYLSEMKYQDAIVVYETVKKHKDASEKISICHAAIGDQQISRAEMLLRNKETKDAIACYQTAFSEFQTAGDDERLEPLALLIADCYHFMNDLDTSLEWYRKAGEPGKLRIVGIAEYKMQTEQYEAGEALALETDTDEGRELLYQIADRMVKVGEFKKSLELYQQILNYKDVRTILKNTGGLQEKMDAWKHSIKSGDKVLFGHKKNGGQNTWIVLEHDENRLVLVAADLMGMAPFTVKESSRTTWGHSSLRAYLNGEFMSAFFDDEEKQAIILTKVRAVKSTDSDSSPGNNTEDYVYLLNQQEADQYRMILQAERGNADWWLRSPGTNITGNNQILVYSVQTASYTSSRANNIHGIRPVIQVSDSADLAPVDWADVE